MKNNTDWDILFNYWQNGNLSCALESVKLFIEKNPHIVNGWIVKADILSNFARYSEAEKDLQEAEKLVNKESMFLVYNQYGHLYKNKGDLKKAKKLYKKSLANKETSEGYNFLGSCYSKQGKFTKAKKHFIKAIELDDSNHDESYYNLAIIARAEERYNKSKNYLEIAIKSDPAYEIALNALDDIDRVLTILDKNIKLQLV